MPIVLSVDNTTCLCDITFRYRTCRHGNIYHQAASQDDEFHGRIVPFIFCLIAVIFACDTATVAMVTYIIKRCNMKMNALAEHHLYFHLTMTFPCDPHTVSTVTYIIIIIIMKVYMLRELHRYFTFTHYCTFTCDAPNTEQQLHAIKSAKCTCSSSYMNMNMIITRSHNHTCL